MTDKTEGQERVAALQGLRQVVESAVDSPKPQPGELEDLRYELDRRREDCDRVREALIPILREHQLSRDDIGSAPDPWQRSLRAGYIAQTAAEVLQWSATEVERLTAEVERLNEIRLNTRDQWRADLDQVADALGVKKDLPTERIVHWAKAAGDVIRDAQEQQGLAARLAESYKAEVSRLREQLATAVVLPQNWTQQVGWLFDVDEVERYTKVMRLVQMWQGLREGTGDTEAEESAPVSESVPATPPMELACSEDCSAKAPECRCTEQSWHRTCCHVTPAVDPLRASAPSEEGQTQASSNLEQNLDEGRPSGSGAAAPQVAPAPAWEKWTECRATEGATGIDCHLTPGHHQWHSGRHTPRTDGTESVGYPLNVQWPRQEWDICAPEKNVWQRGDREPDQLVSAVRGFSTGNVYTRRLEGFGGPWDYEAFDGRAWSTWDSLIENERGAELPDASGDAANAARSEATPEVPSSPPSGGDSDTTTLCSYGERDPQCPQPEAIGGWCLHHHESIYSPWVLKDDEPASPSSLPQEGGTDGQA